jgi:hypothetical protein
MMFSFMQIRLIKEHPKSSAQSCPLRPCCGSNASSIIKLSRTGTEADGQREIYGAAHNTISHEVFMNVVTLVASIAMSLALIGCQKQSDAPKPVTSDSGAASTSASQSVAAPPSALPPSDAAIKPATGQGGADNGNANYHTQATPKELDKKQESASMPLSGQVNNHSTPATTGENK